MSQIIASMYEISEQLGSGGAGIVYRGRHIRLEKDVVLKADKRTLTTKPDTLRREVDALKNLHHTYIPEVYDFICENETVYTVMEYIEGESLDKALNRRGRFPQAAVIKWAHQLLEALVYLHSRPPYGILHSDIKPANIMLTPQGDIRLIDFNIALALGEEGTVRVGFSRGYASPEHYGIDYSSHTATSTPYETELLDDAPEWARIRRARQTGSSSTGSGKRAILLDARSDIYCLGATLYHLLTGRRPPENAKDVPPIQSSDVTPLVASIIQKAMSPDPDQRYQTAREMLDAFQHLHNNDPRTIRHKRRVKIVSVLLVAIFLAGGICTFTGLRWMERIQAEAAEEARIAEEAERIAKRALADTTASETAFINGDAAEAVRLARDALSLHTAYDARAQAALTKALGVYDLSGGYRPHLLLELPVEPTQVVLSPEGTRAGAMAGGYLLVFDTDSGKQLAALPAENSALAQLVFRGEDVVIYAGDGAVRAYDLAQEKELWSGGAATALALSANGSTLATVYKDDPTAVIYDAATGLVRQTVDFQENHLHVAFNDALADPNYDLFALNAEGTMLAAGFSDGGALWVYNLEDREMDIQLFDQSGFKSFQGGFHGPYFAFTGWDGEEASFAIIDTAQLVQCYGYSNRMKFQVQVDESGIFLAVGRLLAKIDVADMIDRQVAYGDVYLSGMAVERDGKSVIRTDAGQLYAFDNNRQMLTDLGEQGKSGFEEIAGKYILSASSDAPELRLWKLDEKPESMLMSYEKGYVHEEARLCGDGKTVMLFRYDQFRLMDMDGNVLADVEIPIPVGDQVYDQQFRRDADGNRLEVIYYSGLVRNYSAADGSLLSEEQKTPPDDSLLEEFIAGGLRIESPLHGAAEVFDIETGEKVGELNREDYLTYVTQVDGYIMTEYLSAETGARYGLLLNENLEVLAELPGLCDVFEDGRLIFDDGRGGLRQTHVYSAEELLAMGENY